MWTEAQKWRKNVEGFGIDELYRRTDPTDVCSPFIYVKDVMTYKNYKFPERDDVFKSWPLYFHKVHKQLMITHPWLSPGAI